MSLNNEDASQGNSLTVTNNGCRLSRLSNNIVSVSKSVVGELRLLNVPDVAATVKNTIQNGDVLSWDASQAHFVNTHFDTATTITYPNVKETFISATGSDLNAGNTTAQSYLTFNHAIQKANQKIVQLQYDFWLNGSINWDTTLVNRINKVPYYRIRGISTPISTPLSDNDPPRTLGQQLIIGTSYPGNNFTVDTAHTITTAGTWFSSAVIPTTTYFLQNLTTAYIQPFAADPANNKIHFATQSASLPVVTTNWQSMIPPTTLNISTTSFTEFQGLAVINDVKIVTNGGVFFNGTGELSRVVIESSSATRHRLRFFGGEGYAEQSVFINMNVRAEDRTRFINCVFVNCIVENNAFTEFTGCTFFNCDTHTITEGYSIVTQSNWVHVKVAIEPIVVNQSGAILLRNIIVTASGTNGSYSQLPFLNVLTDGFAEVDTLKITDGINATNNAQFCYSTKGTVTIGNLEVLSDISTLPVILAQESTLRMRSFIDTSTGVGSLLKVVSTRVTFDSFMLDNCLLQPSNAALIEAFRSTLTTDSEFHVTVNPGVIVTKGIIFLDASEFISTSDTAFNIANDVSGLLLTGDESKIIIALSDSGQGDWVGKIKLTNTNMTVYRFTSSLTYVLMPSIIYDTPTADYHFEIDATSELFITSMRIGTASTSSKLALVTRSSTISLSRCLINVSGIANASAVTVTNNSKFFMVDCNTTVRESANVPVIDALNFSLVGLARVSSGDTLINGSNCSTVIRGSQLSIIGVNNYNVTTSGSSAFMLDNLSHLAVNNTVNSINTITATGLSTPVIVLNSNSHATVTSNFNFTGLASTLMTVDSNSSLSMINCTKSNTINSSIGVVATKNAKVDIKGSNSITNNVMVGISTVAFSSLSSTGIAPVDITAAGAWINSQGAVITYSP